MAEVTTMTTKLFVDQKTTLSKLLPCMFPWWASNTLTRIWIWLHLFHPGFMLMMIPGCLWFYIQHICTRSTSPPILVPISSTYSGLIQRKSPFRNGADYTVTNFRCTPPYFLSSKAEVFLPGDTRWKSVSYSALSKTW